MTMSLYSESNTFVVIGAGISGLAAAHRLRELAGPAVNVTLLEASNDYGGVIRTVDHDGFLLDTGPDNFITTKPWALELSRRIGLEQELLPTSSLHKRAMVVRRGRLLPVPEGFLLMAPTRWWPILTTPIFSIRGKLRMALEMVLPRRRMKQDEDESLTSFVTRRFGREALERLVQPLMSGVYTAVPETLSLRATMPQFLRMESEHGSVIRGMRLTAREHRSTDAGARYSMFMTYRRGMRSLVDALVDRIGRCHIQMNTRVTQITAEKTDSSLSKAKWRVHLMDGRSLLASGVIVAGAAHVGSALLRDVDHEVAGALSEIPYAAAAVVHMAYRREAIAHAMDAFGFVVPRCEKRSIIAASFSSVKYAGRAPEGFILMRVVMGGGLQPHLMSHDDAELVRLAHADLSDLLRIKGDPHFSVVHRHHGVMPQYQVDHLQRVASINNRMRFHTGLELAGNGYEGVGIPDCIHAGEMAAERLLADLSMSLSQSPIPVITDAPITG